jgi:putative hydrolase
MTCDWHTHTTFSHGKGRVEDNVRAAATKGLETLGIADHGPGHVLYGVKRNELTAMREEIRRLDGACSGVRVLMGVEANIVNRSGKLDIEGEDFARFDFVLAGYHYGALGEEPARALGAMAANYLSGRLGRAGAKRRRENTEMVIKALYENDVFMLTHPGDKAPVDIRAVAEACERTGTLFEINAWHALDEDGLRAAAATGTRFAISSDAHTPDRVGDFEAALAAALRAGIDVARIVNIEEI